MDRFVTVQVKLRTDLASIREARRIVCDELANVACGGTVLDDASLLTSELATNAVRHATGTDTYDLTVRVDDGVLYVGLTDACPSLPSVPSPPPAEAAGGRGMWFVDMIAEQWGVEAAPPGKCVWFELPCRPTESD